MAYIIIMSYSISPVFLYLVTPTLGFIRNYIKYKQLSFCTYIRSPIVYFFLHIWFTLINSNHIIMSTLIYERWFWFVYKSLKSLWLDDRKRKKEKYSLKYGSQKV